MELDRQQQIAQLVEHFGKPRHKQALEDADVVMPGGSPECGGAVTVYLKGDGNGGIEDLTWTGQGDTISMGAASIIAERVHREKLNLEDVLALDYEAFVGYVGREVVGSRTRHATLGLSTVKSAIRKHQRDLRSSLGESVCRAS